MFKLKLLSSELIPPIGTAKRKIGFTIIFVRTGVARGFYGVRLKNNSEALARAFFVQFSKLIRRRRVKTDCGEFAK